MKIMTVVGARPQFVKAAALSRVLSEKEGIEEILVHTGQHFDDKMSEIFFEEMQIPHPKYNLGVNSLSHGAMTGRMLEGIEELLQKERPDMLLVYGDTNSTLAGALAARKLHINVAHVEAGLRSFNMRMPEEINRILTDRISNILFCPTDTAIENLKNEGYDNFDCEIVRSGDVMQDAAIFYSKISPERSTVMQKIGGDPFILATIHRAENTDDPDKLDSIIRAVNEIQKEKRIILPLHPRTKKILAENNLQLNAEVIEPVGYFDMIELLKNCDYVMTDSGGVQKEAFFFQKQCVTMREQTEWLELVKNGFNTIVGSDYDKILDAHRKVDAAKPDFSMDLYGKGNASENIANSLVDYLK